MTDDGAPRQPTPRPGQTAFARWVARALEPLPPTLRIVVVLVICAALVVLPLALLVWSG